MKVYELLKKGEEILETAKIEDAKEKAKLLILDILELSKEKYILIKNKEIFEDLEKKYIDKILELKDGKPLEYILGYAYFLGNKYFVNQNVLIPRFETELMVNEAVELIKSHNIKKVLEIGAGSGVIGIHIAKNTDAKVVAVDISDKAIKVAKINSEKLEISKEKYEIIKSDVYENIGEKFDLIISNPPYITTKELKDLNRDVLSEPHLALDGGIDGLDVYSKIIDDGFKYVNGYGSYMILEVSPTVAENVVQLLENNDWKRNEILKDLSDFNRIIISEI